MKLNDEMKETYREALTSAMQTWETEDIVIDGEIVQKGGKEILSLPFPYFIKNIAGIMALVVNENNPEYSLLDFAKTMFNQSNNLPLEIGLTINYLKFMEWLLAQEIEEDETMETMWYDYPPLLEKWNEYFSRRA